MDKEETLVMAYLAGVLDGDGSFSILKKTSCVLLENRRIPRYRPCIQMFNLSENMTNLLKKYLGGNSSKRKKQQENWQDQSYWYCIGIKSCKNALNKILPYLIVKKEVAECLIEFVNKAIPLYQKKRLDQSILLDREKDYLFARTLNDRRDIDPECVSKKSAKLSENEHNWAYVAGLMDTDGSFQISRGVKPNRKSFSYELRATIQMLSIKGINFIYETCGLGNISLITRSRGSNCRQLFHYRWKITNHHELKLFLTRILPYISYKKEQCLTLLDFLDKYSTERTEDQKMLRDNFYNKMKNLNKYGVYKPSLIDLEAQEQGNKAEGESHRERLNEMA